MKKRTAQTNNDHNRTIVLENDNVDEAIGSALKELKIKRSRADIKITEYTTSRFLFFKKKNKRIEVKPKGEKEFLTGILRKFLDVLGIKYDFIAYARKKGVVILSVHSPDSKNRLIGKQGKTINAMEYLLNKIALSNNIRVKIILSIDS